MPRNTTPRKALACCKCGETGHVRCAKGTLPKSVICAKCFLAAAPKKPMTAKQAKKCAAESIRTIGSIGKVNADHAIRNLNRAVRLAVEEERERGDQRVMEERIKIILEGAITVRTPAETDAMLTGIRARGEK